MARTETTVKMANAAGESAETISEQLTSVWNNFYDGSKSLEYYADVMVRLGADTASSSSEIAEGLLKFSSVADTIGLSYEYAAAALTTITDTTRESADVVGTALKTLFSRIQGLSLGETLDDGTTLNKYSSALAAVGINIKDQNGELKEMDTILDELGNKWDSLSKDLQLALAQTVAGVRQYTQLITLMDNWDKMQTNVSRAENAEGSLDELQEIYAEGWEAARDRVTAAAEDIYDSIINDDLFIWLDDALTGVLSLVANFIDGMGGLPGILSQAALLMNALFGDKIAASMRNMATNLGILTKGLKERLQALKEEAATLAETIAANINNDELTTNATRDTSLQVQALMILYEVELNEKAKTLNGYNRERLNLSIILLKNLKDLVIELEKLNAKAKESKSKVTSNWYNRAASDTNNTNLKNLREQLLAGTSNKYNDIGITGRGGVISQLDKEGNATTEAALLKILPLFDLALDKYNQISAVSKQLDIVVDGNTDKAYEMAQAFNLGFESQDDMAGNIKTKLESSKAACVKFIEVLQKLGIPLSEIDTYIEYQRQILNSGNNVLTLKLKFDDYVNTIKNTDWKKVTFSELTVLLGTAIAKTSSLVQGFQNLSSIDFSNVDGFVSGLGTLSMLVPSIASTFKDLFDKNSSIELRIDSLVTIIATVTIEVVKMLDEMNVSMAENAEMAEEAATNLASAAEEAASNLEDILSAFDSYNSAVDTLNDCVKGTQDWNEALEEVKGLISDLLTEYPELLKQADLFTDDGLLNTKAIEAVLNQVEDVANIASAASLGAQIKSEQALLELAILDVDDDLLEEQYSWTTDNEIETARWDRDAEEDLNQVLNYYERLGSSSVELIDIYDALGTEMGDNATITGEYAESLLKLAQLSIEATTMINNANESIISDWAEDNNVNLETGLSELMSDAYLVAYDTFYTAIKDASDVNKKSDVSDLSTLGSAFAGTGYEGLSVTEAFNKARGTNYQLASNGVRGYDDNRTYAFLEDGEVKEYGIKEILAEVAAAAALELLGTAAENASDILNKIDTEAGSKDIAEGIKNYLTSGNFESMGQNDYEAMLRLILSRSSSGDVDLTGVTNYLDEMGLTGLVDPSVFLARLNDYGSALNTFLDGTLNSVLDAYYNKLDGDLTTASIETLTVIGKTLETALLRGGTDLLNLAVDVVNSIAADSMDDFGSVLESIDWSTAEPQDFVDALEEANVVTDLSTEELLAFAESMRLVASTDFSSLAETYSSIIGIVQDLEQGDTISADDYDSLGDVAEGYFTRMMDGTYKLTGDAEEFYNLVLSQLIEKFLEQKDLILSQISNLESLQGTNLSYYTNTDNLTDSTSINTALDIIEALGSTDTDLINKWRELLEEGNLDPVNDLKEALAACDTSYEHFIETLNSAEESYQEIDNAIALSYGGVEELNEALKSGEIGAEAYDIALESLLSTLDEDIDADTYEALTEILMEAAEASEDLDLGALGLSEDLKDNKKEAQKLAKEILRFDSAVEDVADNYEDWLDILNNDNMLDLAAIIDDLRNTYSDLLNIDGSSLSSDFLLDANNLALMKEAAEGSEEAYEQLKATANEDILAQCNIDTEAFNTAASFVEDKLERMGYEDLEVEASLDDTAFLNALTEMVNAAGMTEDLATDYLSNMGVDAEIETQEEPSTHIVNDLEPTVTYKEEDVPTVVGDLVTLDRMKVPTITYKATPHTVEDTAGGFALKVTSAQKSSGGDFKFQHSSNASGSGRSSSSSSGSGGSSGSSSTPSKKTLTQSTDIVDRYHEINDLIDDVTRATNELNTATERLYGKDKLNAMDEEIDKLQEQADLIAQKKQEAEDYLKQEDKPNLDKAAADLGYTLTYDEVGNITNIEDVQRALYAKLHSMEEYYNSLSTSDAQDSYEESTLQPFQDYIDAFEDALDLYEETREFMQDLDEEREDLLREIADLELEKITYKLEVVIDVKEAKDAVTDLKETIGEDIGDTLTLYIDDWEEKLPELAKSQAESEVALLSNYAEAWDALQELYEAADNEADRAEIMSEMQDLQDKIISSAETIEEWCESVEDLIPDAVDAAADRLAAFTDLLDHNTSILDTIQELYELQGVTYKTALGYNALLKVALEKIDASVTNALILKNWYNEMANLLALAQAELDNYVAAEGESGSDYDRLKAARDAYLELFNEALEAYLEAASEAMDELQELYEQKLEKAAYNFGLALTDGLGLDLVLDKYDHYIDTEEEYLDTVNEAYEKASWYNKLLADIDDTSNTVYAAKLKALQEEINARAEGNTLSEYDLEILNAKYEVLKAQAALEDAQNAKNNLQLVRDSLGNWNYRYTADLDAVADAELDLLDALNEYYNIAKQLTKDLASEIIDTQLEFSDAIEEIYLNAKDGVYATDEEFLNALDEATQYYSDKMKLLYDEQEVAVLDMTDAGSEAIEDFENTYADTLDDLTGSMEDWTSASKDFLNECDAAWRDYSNDLNDIAADTSTTLDELAAETDKVSEADDRLQDEGLETVDSLGDVLEKVDEMSEEMGDYAESIRSVIEAYQDLAAEEAAYVNQKSGLNEVDTSVDYSKKMAEAWAAGDAVAYVTAKENRDAKIAQTGDDGGASTKLVDAFITSGHTLSELGLSSYSLLTSEILEKLGITGFATGGYTGDFDDGKLAFLHEKELVLNQEDTENILAAVAALRSITPEFYSNIEKTIDNNLMAALGLLNEKMLSTQFVLPASSDLLQNVSIEANFPNVTSSDEIKDALTTLVNDAAQWVRRGA